MERPELARRVLESSYLTGSFTLRSGKTSHHYFDKYQFESRPELLRELAGAMARLLPPDTEILAGLEMGGVPLATALSLQTGLPVIFVRKQRKEYGTCRVAEGVPFQGKRVCVIEDVITTGGQVVLSTKDLRAEGAIVDTVCCAIYRGEGPCMPLTEALLELRHLFDMDEILKLKNPA